MSDLQVGLLVIGVLVIIGVIIYNRVQEARFRERAESAFAQQPGDALLEAGAARVPANERIEPQFQDDAHHEPAGVPERQEPRAMPEPEPVPAKQLEPATAAALPAEAEAARHEKEPPAIASVVAPQPERERARPAPMPEPEDAASAIAYVADIYSRELVPPSAIDQMIRALGPLAARVQLVARQQPTDEWKPLDPTAPPAMRQVRASLQLVDRRGPVTQQDLVIFQSAVARCAASSGASASIPDAAPFLARSRELDTFCSEVDVVVGINLVAPAGRPFAGTRLRGLAEAAGFRVERGVFVFPDGQGAARFTMEQQSSSAPITAETLRSLQATALTLLLDVPRQADGVAAFDQMVAVGRQLAQALGASLVDDNHVPVTDAGLEQIRNQLRTIYAAMESHRIPAGSGTALRLFS
jgi:FtsZ-interacting cell division protein ZipA